MKEYVTIEAKEMEQLNEMLNSYAKKQFSLVSYQCQVDVNLLQEKHLAIMEKEAISSNKQYSLVCEGIPIDRLEEICRAEKNGGVVIFPGGNKIEALNLTNRSYNCLKQAGFDYITELLQVYDADLQMIKNLGRLSFIEIKEKIFALMEQEPQMEESANRQPK